MLAREHLAQRKLFLVVVGVQLDGLAHREEARLLGVAPLVYPFPFDDTRIFSMRYDDRALSLQLRADEVEEDLCGDILSGSPSVYPFK